MPKITAIYVRVSTDEQDTASQLPDLRTWAAAQAAQGATVEWHTDKFTGKSMKRPAWDRVAAAMRAGKVGAVVVWRLDRLGRTASGLTKLYDEFKERGIRFVSLRDGIDGLDTPAAKLMAQVLASVAEYETEVRRERVKAGQAVARAKGKTWGGSKPGVRKKVKAAKLQRIRAMHDAGVPVAAIARAVKLSRPTIYDVLATELAACPH